MTETAVVDLEHPIPVLTAGTLGAISVTVRLRGDVLGVVRVPRPTASSHWSHLADAIVRALGSDLVLRHRMRPREVCPDRVPAQPPWSSAAPTDPSSSTVP